MAKYRKCTLWKTSDIKSVNDKLNKAVTTLNELINDKLLTFKC